MTEDEIKKADELHMEGKAVFGVIGIVLVLLCITFMLANNKPEELRYFDDPQIETENLA